ncbi:hypothetical protein P3T73_04375 [Kiritimatiellota bacterium B12222]|nr:hypothetical protein P3T73_04375 [Kiritimatiellota bacterium B12222]
MIDNLEYEVYARRIAEEYMYRFDRYDRSGKEALVQLLHSALRSGRGWEIIPDYMERELALKLMNLVPVMGDNARMGAAPPWLKESILPLLAMEMVANTHADRYTQTFARYIREIPQDSETRRRAFRAFAKLSPPTNSWGAGFLLYSFAREDWAENRDDILRAMVAIPSRKYLPLLLEQIEGEDLSLSRIAARAFLEIDTWEEELTLLPPATQIRISLLAAEEWDRDLRKRDLYAMPSEVDPEYLLPYLTLENARASVGVLRRVVKHLQEMQSDQAVPSIVDLMEDLVQSGDATKYWLLYGQCTELMEVLAGQTFWPADSGVKPRNSSSSENPELRAQAQEVTLERIQEWLQAEARP